MEAKNVFKLIFNLSDDQLDQIIIKAGKMGLTVSELFQFFANDITGNEEPDDPGRVDLAEKWLEKLSEEYCEPTFLSCLLGLSGGDLREFIDCLLGLKQKQDKIEEIEAILQFIKEGLIEDMDSSQLSELKRICRSYGVEVDEKNLDAMTSCLNEEKLGIRADMFIPDMGFEPDNLYSAVDVMREKFGAYCKTYEKQDADINEELKKVISWINENESCFQGQE